ncbi:SH3 domain-containing protein [Oscillatoria sp. FACHB-1406]|uniref:SH3 domain-containing protein n=1 Tax=Oscillatoria sp. FACHB-1406 TaxID=2692846 RepID=UPI001687B462|nr:SH3 domain-containing protein [Oscillatoria sp. FACHB-1406]MBD2577232.1 SH3 domain-containing protein [Oscillatoria sp. FACHB-1406]
MSRASRIFQIFFGFIIGIVILAGASAAAAYYFLTRLTDTPPKPVFSEELPKKTAPKAAKPASKTEKTTPTPQPSQEVSPKPPEELEPGAYKARVTWSEGLSLRDEPTTDGNRVGGVAFKEELIVIKDSDDGKWQKVRIPSSNTEGWIKSGNIEKIDEKTEDKQNGQ